MIELARSLIKSGVLIVLSLIIFSQMAEANRSGMRVNQVISAARGNVNDSPTSYHLEAYHILTASIPSNVVGYPEDKQYLVDMAQLATDQALSSLDPSTRIVLGESVLLYVLGRFIRQVDSTNQNPKANCWRIMDDVFSNEPRWKRLGYSSEAAYRRPL